MKRIVDDSKIDQKIRDNIKKLLNNPRIKCEDLGSKNDYDSEFEFSPEYTKKEINNELYDLNCETPNVFIYYSNGKVNIEFEHELLDMEFDADSCLKCSISQKCPRYQWDK